MSRVRLARGSSQSFNERASRSLAYTTYDDDDDDDDQDDQDDCAGAFGVKPLCAAVARGEPASMAARRLLITSRDPRGPGEAAALELNFRKTPRRRTTPTRPRVVINCYYCCSRRPSADRPAPLLRRRRTELCVPPRNSCSPGRPRRASHVGPAERRTFRPHDSVAWIGRV